MSDKITTNHRITVSLSRVEDTKRGFSPRRTSMAHRGSMGAVVANNAAGTVRVFHGSGDGTLASLGDVSTNTRRRSRSRSRISTATRSMILPW